MRRDSAFGGSKIEARTIFRDEPPTSDDAITVPIDAFTYNTDFAQEEVDVQQINFTRFFLSRKAPQDIMKVLVDTSVWEDFFNGHPSAEAKTLEKLIVSDEEICTCGVVVSEVFQGLKRDDTRSRLEELFRELTFLEPEGIQIYFTAAELYRSLRKRGVTTRSTIDCLIAAIGEENNCFILAKDKDLRAIVESGMVDLPSWPA